MAAVAFINPVTSAGAIRPTTPCSWTNTCPPPTTTVPPTTTAPPEDTTGPIVAPSVVVYGVHAYNASAPDQFAYKAPVNFFTVAEWTQGQLYRVRARLLDSNGNRVWTQNVWDEGTKPNAKRLISNGTTAEFRIGKRVPAGIYTLELVYWWHADDPRAAFANPWTVTMPLRIL
ncbi:MAG: hypothetical protein D6816_15965 [Bacteroidetes bacterium]|nr:MAG: hypothetical protein D6816_15965 [Bacteroidota bacterium]